MNASLPALGLVLVGLSCVLWLWTEAIARGLAASGLKSRWWAQLALHAAPPLLGALVCALPGVFPALMDVAGYTPKSPPTGWVSAFVGALAGAGSVVYHDKVRAISDAWTSRQTPKGPTR